VSGGSGWGRWIGGFISEMTKDVGIRLIVLTFIIVLLIIGYWGITPKKGIKLVGKNTYVFDIVFKN